MTRVKSQKNQRFTADTKAVNLLQERYNNMPNWEKISFRTNIASATGRHEQTIYRWLRGSNKPSLAEQKIIADYLNERVGDLFNV